ncbi:MAG: NADH-quinone oxidoreductase subunit M [Chloroflexi bacterium]|nr:NADH-quinone oxidoreductase subunit M [Chloroflexota bacterium]MBT4002714.1 NADH-quinone oxidoreductase subunit M [Chloroflexota bacterium]MBT4306423.1 NADH-quinone oxidoreductase subunit M [Chloroflexota bacterium]MBT4534922.1 NADH-quinone oxidoreductase subunit M [Chloroflexota bacterium]MBT4682336.1 NADH-quinone oxidoreductase subunit M [Chloroflexota bacterium]
MDFILEPLNLVTFFPLVGVLLLLLLKNEQKKIARWVALVTALVTFGISLWVLSMFDASNPGLQFMIEEDWIQVAGWKIKYALGMDGISILLVLLTTFLTPIAILSTWKAIDEKVRDFQLFFLLLEMGMLGVFLAQDLFLFYVFWEFTLVPMYFLIGIWGGEKRMYAAIKFFLYTMAGSILMLLAILWLGIRQGTFFLPELIAKGGIPADVQFWLFLAFAAAFAIKVPMWPLHSWLPDAHVQAPTAGSVILAGVLLKMGTYGFVRFNLPLFPEAAVQLAPTMALLAVIGILYGAAVSYSQTDVKKLVAYSSVSHLGFVILGIFALNEQGIAGGILQMVNHGISTGALFLLIGFIYERRHTRDFDQFGGLWKVVPVYAVITLIVSLSSMGLPGLNGFVGEFAILLGAWGAGTAGGPLGTPLFAAFAAAGVILAAVYILFMFQKMFLGPITVEENKNIKDLNWRELLVIVPLLVFIFWIGLYPKPFFDLIGPSVSHLVEMLPTAVSTVLH